jgi:tetraacyldisaccharide 4'-kinase
VGGTGKTPIVVSLCSQLAALGLKTGVISRGYGGSAASYPQHVAGNSDPKLCGDEPVLIAQRTGVPLVIDPDRYRAYETLTQTHNLDLVISDDGLQHYALPRDYEILVVDGKRGFGNQRCLPVGPLREPLARIGEVDCIVQNGVSDSEIDYKKYGFLGTSHVIAPVASGWVNVQTGQRCPVDSPPWSKSEPLNAITGIGNPQRFFNNINDLGYEPKVTYYPDHYQFTARDFASFGQQPVVMTEKDAVKCRSFAQPNWWYLEISVELPDSMISALSNIRPAQNT